MKMLRRILAVIIVFNLCGFGFKKMFHLKVPIFLLLVLFGCALAWGGGRDGQEGGFGGMMGGGFGGGRGYQGLQGQNFGGPSGRQLSGEGDKKYRSNLYNDEDVYGYDATYPNGEAAYINYKSKDARARRGQEFARTSRAYSRQGGAGGPGGERSYGFDQMGKMW